MCTCVYVYVCVCVRVYVCVSVFGEGLRGRPRHLIQNSLRVSSKRDVSITQLKLRIEFHEGKKLRTKAGQDISHQLKKYPTGQAVTHLQTSSVKMMEEIALPAIPARRQPLSSEVEKAFKSPSSSTKMKDSVRQLL
ncbi:hypothetical protein AVEN_126934-1 [Araneus ventricosus]|uniref:Uncharacterized protein n=1 Tax=Araneus ventricosus TaxID=182803 RepID=A0A4Y2UIQ7_ARAVE|nr:hypothetical protein AVEN_126934-1 [Araneus ventricosus]